MYINIKFKNPEIFSFLFSLYLFSQINKTEIKYNDDSKTKVCKKKKKRIPFNFLFSLVWLWFGLKYLNVHPTKQKSQQACIKLNFYAHIHA